MYACLTLGVSATMARDVSELQQQYANASHISEPYEICCWGDEPFQMCPHRRSARILYIITFLNRRGLN